MNHLRHTVAWCICAVLGLASLAACGSSSSPATDPAPAAATAADPAVLLAAWIARSLPTGARFSVDDDRTRDLVTAAGVSVTVRSATASATATAGADSYRISAGTPAGVGVRALSSRITAVPVARFGAGSSGLLVDQLVPGSSAATAAAQAQDRDRRVAAAAALLTNPTVRVAPAARAVMGGAGLDLRAAALVAVLATTVTVDVLDVVADPAETLAGRPARVVVLGGASPGEIRATAAATVGAYRPTITAVTATTSTLRWNLSVTTTLTGV